MSLTTEPRGASHKEAIGISGGGRLAEEDPQSDEDRFDYNYPKRAQASHSPA